MFLKLLKTSWVNRTCVAPIIGSGIGYRPIIGVVMHISILGAFPYNFFDFIVFSKHESLTCSAHK